MTSLAPIDMQRALDLLDQAVQRQGAGYVYQGVGEHQVCVYFDQGEPSCLIGCALAAHGVTPADISDGDNWDLEITGIELDCLTDDARRVFFAAQARQDNKVPWGLAVAAARHEAAKIAEQMAVAL